MDTETLTMDAEEQSLRDMGHEADMAEGRPIEQSSATPAEPRAPAQEQPKQEPQPSDVDVPEQKPDSSEIKSEEPAQKEQRPRDPNTGKFQKPDTEYRKAQKEEERKGRTWQSIQAEREQLKQEQLQWQEQRRMEQLQAQRQTFGPLQHEGLNAKQYYDGAEVFAKQGDHEKAYEALKISMQIWQADLGRADEIRTTEQEYQWRAQINHAKETQPDLFDPRTPAGGYMNGIMQSHADWLYKEPNGQGVQFAKFVADLLVKADLLSELQDEAVELRAYKEAHQHKSQPGKGGHAAPKLGEKDFDEMNLEEMEAHLKGVTAEADNYR